NKLMEKIMLYTTTVFFIFTDILNINGHIGLNSVLLILLINTGIFIVIALKRYNKDDCNSYNFKENLIKLIDKLENLDNTQKPKKDSPDINKETILSRDIAELVRKKYVSRPSPIEPKSDFAKAVKTIFK
ncbi:MAG: hypothetical protein LUD00_08975, partial [Prevotellaceae bacterium]|nr:hypothetical protein [Prevotellaceae bacterium]